MKRKYLRHGVMIMAMMSMFALLVSCGSSGGGSEKSVDTAAISLAVSPSIIPADGSSSATVSASMTDKSGAAVPAETSVTFSTTLGTFPNGDTSYSVKTPDDSGSVTISLIAGTIPGTSKIVAKSKRVSQRDEIILAGADAITLTAVPEEVTAVTADDPEGSDQSKSTIRAFVTDVDGKPVDGQDITFSLTPAVGSLSSATATTSGGLATVNFTASTVAAKVTIKAEASNGRSETVIVSVLPAADSGSISVSADPASIPADGISTSVVTATLKDNDEGPLGDLPVTFSKEFRSLPENNTYSGAGTKVTSPFHSSGGNTTFTLTHDGASNFIVWLWRSVGGRVALLANEIGPTGEGAPLETIEELDDEDYFFEVDADGNWSIEVDGEISETPSEILETVDTDRSGQAQITYTSSVVKGDFTIQATCGELSDEVTITQAAGSAAQTSASASPSTIYANGINVSTVRATVRDVHNNLVEDGVSVNFSATAGTIGSTSTTDDGVASTTLTSISSADTVTSAITASVDGLTDTTAVEFKGVSLTDMAAAPAAVFVNNISSITVRLRDSSGIAVPGETITFTTTGGTLVTQTATTDENGVASVDLIAPTQAGTGTVTASYGLRTAQTDVAFNINPSGSVVVTAGATSIVADGSSQVRITAEVKDSSGNDVADGTIVSFRTTAGRFDSASPWSPTVINTITTNGKATAMLISSTNVGTATITATSLGVSGSASVSFISAAVSAIDLTASPNNLTADGASTSTIRALVKDGYGNVVNNETVTFSVTTTGTKAGTLSARTATTSDGVATVVYTASKHPGSVDMVKAETTNGTSAMVTITLIEPSIGSVECSVGCDSIVVGGSEEVLISATVLDRNGNLVPDGTLVTFNTTAGDINSTIAGPQYTVNASTTNGVAEVMLRSSDQAGTATIKVIAGGVCCTTSVDFVAGPVSQIALSAYPSTLTADGTSTSTIQAVVTDAYGNPVDGEVLFFMAPGLGMLDSLKAETSDGVATATYTAGHVPGTDTLTARSAGATSNSVVITLLSEGEGLPVGSVILAATTTTGAVANGSDSYQIVAQVLDTSDQPMKNQTVVFSATGNTGLVAINPPIGTTANDGTTTCSVTDISAINDTVVISASSGGVGSVGSVGLAFMGTGGGGIPVGSVILAATETTGKVANGVDSYTITVQVLDTSNQPMKNQAVTFSASGNSGLVAINPPVTTTEPDGTATCEVTDISSISDTVDISASSGGVNSVVPITLNFSVPAGPGIPASLGLSTSGVTVKSDNSDSATITATVLDSDSAVVEGITVEFSADGGQLSASSAQTDVNGQAQVAFSSGTVDRSNQVVTITARVAGLVPAQIPIQVVGSTLTLSTDKSSITSDGLKTATLTMLAKDAGGSAVYNTLITVTWSATGGGGVTLSPLTGYTNVMGELKVTVTGTSPGSVRVTADGLGATATQDYSVGAVGFSIIQPQTEPFSWITMDHPVITESGQIAFADANPDTITRSDPGGSFIADGYNSGDRIMVGGSGSNDTDAGSGNPPYYTIDTVTATTLTLVAADELADESAGASVIITNSVLIKVQAPTSDNVIFSTTFGAWDGTNAQVVTKAVVGGFATAVFSSNLAGVATVHVQDEDDVTLQDAVDVVVSSPSASAAHITMQSNTHVVPPSVGGISHTSTLTVSVRTSADTGHQPVGGAPVAFSIGNQTGGGEKIFPVIVYTDASGVATTTFTSGSLSSGAEGVAITATVLGNGRIGPLTTLSFDDNDPNPDTIFLSGGGSFLTSPSFESGEQVRVEGSTNNDGYYVVDNVTADTLTLYPGESLDTEPEGRSVTIAALTTAVNIVIGGTAGSLVLGHGIVTELSSTAYSLPMSVLVADSNGNPVPGATVSLNAWPEKYSVGVWVETISGCAADITGSYDNEDANENLFLDPGEDENGDGELTPPNSAAGTIPETVTTNDNGIANFDLVYLKSSSAWIVDRIRAHTLVLGTETTSFMSLRLPPSLGPCGLPDSPFNRELPPAAVHLTAVPESLLADGTSISTISAYVTDARGDAVADDQMINFSVTSGAGSVSSPTAKTTNGVATVTYTASTTVGPETITAITGNGFSDTVDIVLYGQDSPASLALSTSHVGVKSDNSVRATITATVLNSNNAVVEGVTVAFSATGGQLSASYSTTDDNGQAQVFFSSGTVDKSNQVVLVEASVPGLPPRQIPIQIVGTTVTLSTPKTNLEIDPLDPDKAKGILTIALKDAGLVPIYDAPVTLSVDPSSTGAAVLSSSSGDTNVAGELQVEVTGTGVGSVIVNVESMGVTASQIYSVGAIGAAFGIIHPTADPHSWDTLSPGPVATTGPSNQIAFADTNPDTITRSDGGNFAADFFGAGQRIMVVGSSDNDGEYEIATVAAGTLTLAGADALTAELAGASVVITNGILVRVKAPTQANVQFVSTLGTWDGTSATVVTKPVVGGEVDAVLSSTEAGVATIQVVDADDPSATDTMTVAFSAPSSQATQISLQASSTVVAPSISGVNNTVTLTATVKNVNDQVVGGAAVAFAIQNPTGGGEFISPAIAYTNTYGVAASTFASGSLSSDAEGVVVRATVIGAMPAVESSITIVIGGTAGSVVMGRSTEIGTNDTDTYYIMPMSLVVADSGGNPVPGAIVSLNLWPSQYARGYWFRTEPVLTGFFDNEDTNRNLILDPGEDENGDGELTPPNSAAGTLPAKVTTDDNGVANFNLVYLKSSASWIEAEVTASTFVLGTETKSTYKFWLPYKLGDEGYLPDSPYNMQNPVSGISLTATPSNLGADGHSQSTIEAIVTDAEGNAIAGETLFLGVTPGKGALSDATATTGIGGIATVTYTAATSPGVATVTVRAANGTMATTEILLTSVLPDRITLATSQVSVKSDNSDSATITATVVDENSVVVEGAVVVFNATGGQLSAASVETDENGKAEVAFSSGNIDQRNQVVTITALVAGLPPAQVPVQVTGSTLTLATDNTIITTDGSTTDTLTITAKNAGGVPVYNVALTLTVAGTGGATLSAYSGNTDTTGKFQVTVTGNSAGSVTVTVEGMGTMATQGYTVSPAGAIFGVLQPQTDPFAWHTLDQAPVPITGPSTQIAFADNDPANDTITRSDGGDFAADGFGAGQRIMVGGSTSNDTDAGSGTPSYYTIDTVTASTLTLAATDELTDELAGATVTVTNGVLVTVQAPTLTNVQFVSTLGAWDGGVSTVVTKAVSGGKARAVISSSQGGVATVQVIDPNDPTTSDTARVVFSAPSNQAAYITLQSNTSVVPISVGGNTYTAILTASVRTSSASGRQPVGGAPVAFSISNQAGGGETVSPAIVFTDDSGVATTTFTSGSLASGAEGVTVNAAVLGQGSAGPLTTISFHDTNPDTIVRSDAGSFVMDMLQPGEQIRVQGSQSNDGEYVIASVSASTLELDEGDSLTPEAEGSNVVITAVTTSVNVVIGGTAGSLVIGRGSEISAPGATTYSLPMSVLVADSNGNPVSGATVSLSTWPIYYSTGSWVHRVEETMNPTTGIITTTVLDECDPVVTADYRNEDINENLFLDPGEDAGTNPGHGDGQLTPPNSSAGTVPVSITTDQNGVATFDLVYMKSSAVWITNRIRATTLVLGTETTSSMNFRLPYLQTEGEGCFLPSSPYNTPQEVSYIGLTAAPTSLTADGSSTSTIRAEVFDQDGGAMVGEVLTFEMAVGSGTITPPTRTTDVNGVAEVVYTASTTSGTETVRATANNGISATVDIDIVGSTVPDALSLSTSQVSVKSDNSDSATITATVLDADNVVVEGVAVTFSADGGQLSASSVETDASGQAQVTFSSGTVDPANQVVTITARVSGIAPAQIPIQVVGSTLALNTNNNVITSDGSTTATLTILAKDASGTPVYGAPITLTSTGTGTVTVSPSAGDTDILGELDVTVTGTSAGEVTVTAAGLGTTAAQDYEVILAGAIFFRIIQPQSDPISWSTLDAGPVAITGPSTQIAFADANPDTITRSDGGDFTLDGFSADDRIMVGGSTSNDTDAGSGTPSYYTVAGVTASTLTLIASDQLTAEAAGASVTITNGVLVTVEAPPPTTSVKFATTFGSWDGGGSEVISKNVVGGYVSAVFSSSLAGVASIHVSADDDPASFDSLEAAISAPTADAAHITLQSNTYVVPLSVGNISNTATLTASVRTSSATGRQPVGGAPVAFSIQNQTGGGETVFPVIVYTDSSGTATTTFTSGSLSSGAEGVTMSATVLGQGSTGPLTTISFNDTDPDTIMRSDVPAESFITDGYQPGEQIRVQGSANNDGWYIIDSVTADTITLDAGDTLTAEAEGNNVTITAVTASTNIVVGGTAGSLVIGRGSEITVLSPTTYSLPMSVLVADSNGNPVPAATVSLNAWPIQYSTGEWVELIIITDQYCEAKITGTYPNEDINENLFLDPGEDTGNDPGHGDGELTPPNSAAGTVPMTVTTDANGVANFDLVYMKSSAMWIVDRIQASTLVLGTETTSSMTFRLPAEKTESWTCELPDSAYNRDLPVDHINLTATPNNLTADGSSTSTIRAVVYDENGLAVEGEVVGFDLTVGTGTLSVPTATSNDQGVAEITYTTSTTAGTETVTATTANGTFATVDIELIVALVGSVEVDSGSNSIVADGTSHVTISATVLDTNGNNVLDGTTVTFSTTVGDIDDATPGTQTTYNTTTVNGVASSTLTSSTNVGTATIRATAGGVMDSATVAFVPGAVSTISLGAAPSNLTADGASTSTIRALVTDANGNAVDGETITFTMTAGTGTLSSQTATTSNGIATVIYTASSVVGTETVRAEATDSTVFDTVDITLVNVVVGTVTVSVGSSTAVADGAAQTLIAATVEDTSGNSVADGTTVTFTTTAGDIDNATPGTQTTVNATTTNGVATTWLVSPTNVGTAAVIATVGGVTDSTTVTFIGGAPNTIALSATPNNLTADGASTNTISALVTDANGNAVDDETITFTMTAGTGTLSSQTATTTNGIATVAYTASTVVGTETVRAEATDSTVFDTVDITLVNVVVGTVTVSPGSDTAPADGASQTLISATVQDNGDNNVADGTTVTFTTTAGDIDNVTPGTQTTVNATTTNGVATAWLVSPTNVGTATVTAVVGGVTDNTTVTFTASAVNGISLIATPNNLTADGASTSAVTAFVTDANGNAAEDETVTFTVTAGTGTLSSQTATTTNGIATVTYTASTVVGTETVRAEATESTVFDTANITLISAVVGAVTVNAGSETAVADGASPVLISATVQDSGENNVTDGTVVTFTTTAGSLSGVTTTTNGVATATLTSPTNVGIGTVTATAGGVSDSTEVTFIPGAVAAVSVTAAPNNLTADGTSTSTIRAYVTDGDNNAVEDELISFSVTSGTGILSSANDTTTGGVATVTYTASTTPGTETITAESTNGVSVPVNIALIGPQIGGIVLSANPTSLPADGTSEATVSATVTLVGGGDAPDGTTVSFSVVSDPAPNDSSITATASTGAGVATAFLTSGTGVGTATIRAEAGGRRAEIEVEYTPGSLTLTIVPNSLLGTGDGEASVIATLKDVNGLAPACPPCETVDFTLDDLSLGSITPSATSDVNGEAEALFLDAGIGGTITVTGTWTTAGVDVTGSATIDIQPPPAFIENAEDSPDPASINIKGTGGKSTSLITFDVKDSGGNLVADGYRIDFSLDSGPNGGENIIPLSATTVSGQVSTILYSGFKSGPVSIKATYHHDTSISTTTSQIAISGGPPVGEEFGIFAEYVNVSGFWVANLLDNITINAGDIYGNAIPDDTAISFKTYNTGGFFTPNTATTIDGMATNVLHSAGTYLQPLQGFLSVTGEAINGGRTTHVTSLAVAPSPDANVMYAGTDGGGVYKSIDSGATWVNISRSSENAKQGQNWIDPHVKGNSAICVDPDDPNRVYVGTGYLGRGNVYRSMDGGMNWNSNNVEEWNGIFDADEAVLTVLCDGGGNDYVWIGTEGLGALFATDGETFQWGGIATTPTDPAPPNTGTGTMSQPTLSASSQTETWTATYEKTGATASTPVLDTSGSGSGAGGSMPSVSATEAAETETWTLTYTGGVSIGYGAPASFVPGPGTLTVLNTSASTFTENWIVRCVDVSTQGGEVFSVSGSASGLHTQANANQNYTTDNGELTFFIPSSLSPAPPTFALGDTITFSTTRDGWSVSGSVSGAMTQDARTGVEYTSDNDEVSFKINAGSRFYQTTDFWTFNTTITGDWEVVGTVSGTQFSRAQNNMAYASDNYEVRFTISEGATGFDPGDDFSFNVTESGLGYGTVVRDMVKVPGTHGATAVLYAGTNTGIFRSTDGGLLWNPTTPFTGDFITTLALHPITAGVIYAGTEDAGVWVSHDSGTTWTPYTSGMGEGLSATTPMADPNNVGNGVISAVTVSGTTDSEYWSATCNQAASATTPLPGGGNVGNGTMSAVTVSPTNTVTENWTVACTAAAVDGGTFSVTGSVSGLQAATASVGTAYTSDGGEVSFTISDGSSDFVVPDSFTFSTTATTFSVTGSVSGLQVAQASVGTAYTSDGNEVSFTISDGSSDFIVGDSFTFSSTRDLGRTIMDLQVVTDNVGGTDNDQLYAITYFWGPLEPHAVGNVYVHPLADTLAQSFWGVIGDMETGGSWSEANTSLLPAYDPPDDMALFAQHVMAVDASVSPSALYIGGEGINLYKATGGALFTGAPVWQESKSGLTNLIMARMPILFTGPCTMSIFTERNGNIVTFTVYIQDENGNPPVEGSVFFSEYEPETGDSVTLANVTYPDCYVHQGTFRDPGDPSTNDPYMFTVTVLSGDKVHFTFTPWCTDVAPGCSGAIQNRVYQY
ncbi:MAG: invasin domain 3-containing protein [Thermodesulfobacteriota bacterium]|nr:invasin domain 3-containing protein [Thermodesulfobacteriota bacterium]